MFSYFDRAGHGNQYTLPLSKVARSIGRCVVRVIGSDAHESSILPEVLGLASIFLPRNRLALLEPYSITLAYCRHSFSVLALSLTPLAATREWCTLLDDPRLTSCSTRPLVCITGHRYLILQISTAAAQIPLDSMFLTVG
jgi:hypothetical protein